MTNDSKQCDPVTVLVAMEFLKHAGEWSEPVQVTLKETPDVGTGWELIFQTVGSPAEVVSSCVLCDPKKGCIRRPGCPQVDSLPCPQYGERGPHAPHRWADGSGLRCPGRQGVELS